MTETLSPEPIGLNELVSYQHGSVVSNTIHKDAAGTITAFAFDAGEGLSEHTAPASIPHAVHAATRFKMLLTMIRLR